MEESGVDLGELKEHLKGNTSIMFSDYGNAPAKVIKKFRKDGDKPILKGAFIYEDIYIGDEQIDFLSTLKSKEEIIFVLIIILLLISEILPKIIASTLSIFPYSITDFSLKH